MAVGNSVSAVLHCGYMVVGSILTQTTFFLGGGVSTVTLDNRAFSMILAGIWDGHYYEVGHQGRNNSGPPSRSLYVML